MKYMYESKPFFEKNNSIDLYWTIDEILSKKLMSFCEIMFRFSEGIGIVCGEGSGIILEDDWDDDEFDGTVEFYVGDNTNSIIDIRTYAQSLEHICINYINFHPEDKERIDKYIDKIHNRYANFL